MVTYHQVRDTIERALHEHGLDAHVLAGAVAELVPSDQREISYEYVYDKIRTSIWPPPRCACELARTAWRAVPMEVRSVDTPAVNCSRKRGNSSRGGKRWESGF